MTSPVKMLRTCSTLRSETGLALFTITAIPSMAITVGVKPPSSSLSFRAREAMPMSQVPSMAMFMPVEAIYAEVLREPGFFEELQRAYKVTITGPTTLAAFLNSLQMGFKTLAIQKRSSEVWKVLEGVKREFDTFADVLASAQNRINQANNELDKLIGVRTRQIQKTLRDVRTATEKYLENSEENDV